MSSNPNYEMPSETTDERTIRLLHDEITHLHGQAGRANDREVDLAASLVAAESRLRDSGVMLHEVNHRAKNSIQIAMSLLGLQMHATQSEEVRVELASAIRRLGNIAAAHLMLNSQSSDEQTTSFGAYLTLICTETHQSLGGDRIALIVNTDELALDTSRAINLALIASEALTNSMKYAFPDSRQGTISVDFHHTGGAAALSIADDGIGFRGNIARRGARPALDPDTRQGDRRRSRNRRQQRHEDRSALQIVIESSGLAIGPAPEPLNVRNRSKADIGGADLQERAQPTQDRTLASNVSTSRRIGSMVLRTSTESTRWMLPGRTSRASSTKDNAAWVFTAFRSAQSIPTSSSINVPLSRVSKK